MGVVKATNEYDNWLRSIMVIDEDELNIKHNKMTCSEFPFLRATFYRWSHLFPKHFPELCAAPRVLGVGDLHIENFGTWRDAEGRLTWGVNDFDEACFLPYTNDLVRLATSACLAIQDSSNALNLDIKEACASIQEGYVKGMQESRPFVLAEDHKWLRDVVMSKLISNDKKSDDHDDLFAKFCKKYRNLEKVKGTVSAEAVAALNSCFPQPTPDYVIRHREAGLGSLGRPRLTAVAEDWRGGVIVREAKALAPSAWLWANQEEDKSSATELAKRTIYYRQIVAQAVRSSDPWLMIAGSWVVRRIGPDTFKVAIEDLDLGNKGDELQKRLLRAMGKETANIHLSSREAAAGVVQHLGKQSSNYTSSKWLLDASIAMAQQTKDDFQEWRKLDYRCPNKAHSA